MSAVINRDNNVIAVQATTPATLLQMAVEQSADLDRLERLMDLQTKWEEGEAQKAYTKSMTAFRSECPVITKDKQGHNSKYSTLAHTLDLIKKPLSEYGLSHSWKTNQHDNGQITVECFVTHRLGHKESTSLTALGDTSGSKNAIQALGSTVSYLQRYTLFSILGLASSDQDDDGKASALPATLTLEQSANIQALFEEVGGDKKQYLANFKVDSFDSIPASQYKRAISLLESKRGK